MKSQQRGRNHQGWEQMGNPSNHRRNVNAHLIIYGIGNKVKFHLNITNEEPDNSKYGKQQYLT